MLKKGPKALNIAQRVVFLQSLIKRARTERSSYGRLLFQENVIALSVVATLQTISLVINDNLGQFGLNRDRKIEFKKPLKITFGDKEFERKTLGQLCGLLKPYLSQENKLKSNLKRFVDDRNRLTHSMFDEYENIDELEKGSIQLVVLGEDVINDLNDFRNKLQAYLLKTKVE